MRVVSFISGGLICFGISALYNFAVKRFELPPPDADGGDGFGGGGTGGNGNFGGGGGFNGGGGVA
jgi:hypothetical protein